jgi:hypothetical protein
MGDVVDFVGSDQPGHPVSFIVEVIHGAGSTSRYVRAGAGTIAQLCAMRGAVRRRTRRQPGTTSCRPVPLMSRPPRSAGYGTQSSVTVRSVNSGGAVSTLAINSWMAC